MRLIASLVLLFALLFVCTLCDYTDNYEKDINTHRLVVGVLTTNSIVTHVAQNFVNFLASTLAWTIIDYLLQVSLLILGM